MTIPFSIHTGKRVGDKDDDSGDGTTEDFTKDSRSDSWDLSSSGHPMLRTENDLRARFKGAGYDSHGATFKDVIRKDFAQMNGSAKKTWHEWATTCGMFRSPAGVFTALRQSIPIFGWLKTYQRSYLLTDVSAGLVEGIMEVPSGLAYAKLAGMPNQYGLYTNLLPQFIYMIFGTCAQVSFGVTAIEALFLSSSVRGIIGEEYYATNLKEGTQMENDKVQFTLFFSMMVGLWQIVFRIFQLDFIGTLLSDPVMSGFTTGGAIIIATSQLGSFLGVTLETGNSEFLPETWKEALTRTGDWNWVAFTMCICSIIFLQLGKVVQRKYLNNFPVPWQIILVIIGIIVTNTMNLYEEHNLPIVKKIPTGLPPFSFPSIPTTIPGMSQSQLLLDALWPSFLCALFVYVMTLSLGMFFSNKNGYKSDPKKELLALGMANSLSCMFGAFIASASFSRSAVVNSLNVKTNLHSSVALMLMMLTLLVITQQLYYLPKNILAAIVLMSVWPMLEFSHGLRYFCLSKAEFLVWFTTFIVALFMGAMYGIYAGVAVSLLIVLFRSARPDTTILGRLPGTTVYRNIKRFPMAQEIEGVRIIRHDGGLSFTNWERFTSALDRLATDDIHTIIVDASCINDIDTSSVRGLLDLIKSFKLRGVALLFANWKGPQRDMLSRGDFYRHVTQDTLFLALHDAACYARDRKLDPTKSVHGMLDRRSSNGKRVVEVDVSGEEIVWKVDYQTSPNNGAVNGNTPPRTESYSNGNGRQAVV